jgi:hypothetical protein
MFLLVSCFMCSRKTVNRMPAELQCKKLTQYAVMNERPNFTTEGISWNSEVQEIFQYSGTGSGMQQLYPDVTEANPVHTVTSHLSKFYLTTVLFYRPLRFWTAEFNAACLAHPCTALTSPYSISSHQSLSDTGTVAARSKPWIAYSRSRAVIVGSNPTQGMDICLCLFCLCK